MSDKSKCEHENFAASVNVSRIEDSSIWYADVSLKCSDCEKQISFICPNIGLSPDFPTADIEGKELRLPFKPFGSDRFFNVETN